jgi:hypothetical protein
MARFVLSKRFVILQELEEVMMKVNIDNIGELAIVECEGRILQSEVASKLRDAVSLKAMLALWCLN